MGELVDRLFLDDYSQYAGLYVDSITIPKRLLEQLSHTKTLDFTLDVPPGIGMYMCVHVCKYTCTHTYIYQYIFVNTLVCICIHCTRCTPTSIAPQYATAIPQSLPYPPESKNIIKYFPIYVQYIPICMCGSWTS